MPARRHTRAVAVLALAGAIGCGIYAAQQLKEGGARSVPPPSPAARILELLNFRRGVAGLRPLHRDVVLASLARIHNRDMLRDGFYAHDAPQGQTFDERVAYLHRRLVGETIAWGTGGFATPAGIVNLWMASPPHRRVILTPGLRRVGISVLTGLFQGQTGASVATADFSS